MATIVRVKDLPSGVETCTKCGRLHRAESPCRTRKRGSARRGDAQTPASPPPYFRNRFDGALSRQWDMETYKEKSLNRVIDARFSYARWVARRIVRWLKTGYGSRSTGKRSPWTQGAHGATRAQILEMLKYDTWLQRRIGIYGVHPELIEYSYGLIKGKYRSPAVE